MSVASLVLGKTILKLFFCTGPTPGRPFSGKCCSLYWTTSSFRHGTVLFRSSMRIEFNVLLFQSDNASPEKVAQSPEIMIHHSRNTAQKQWAETKVLTISGVVRVFNTKRKLLKTMDDYSKAGLKSHRICSCPALSLNNGFLLCYRLGSSFWSMWRRWP